MKNEPRICSQGALRRWRSALFIVLTNPRIRFRTIVNLAKAQRFEAEKQKLLTQGSRAEENQRIDSNSESLEVLSSSALSPKSDDYFSCVDDIEGGVGGGENGENGNVNSSSVVAQEEYISFLKAINLEWSFIIINIVLELLSIIFDMLCSRSKPYYALVGMLTSSIAMLICMAALIYKGRKESVTWSWKSKMPWLYYPPPNDKCFGTFADIVGLICTICQSIFATVNFILSYHGHSVIKISILPLIFAIGVGVSKYLENPITSGSLPRGENQMLEDGPSARAASARRTFQVLDICICLFYLLIILLFIL